MDSSLPAPLACQRDLFDVPADVVYLNAASKSALPKAAIDAGRVGAAAKGRPWAIDEAARFAQIDDIRARFAALIGATADDIAIQPSAAYGVATAAAHLNPPAGSRILVLEGQYPSNVYAWLRLAERTGAVVHTVPRPADGDWTRVVLAAIDESVSIGALPPCHWTDGATLDSIAVGRALKAVGADFVVDATQWVGAVPFDVTAAQADYLVCAAYKWLLGPYGLSFMYAAPGRQDGLPLEDHLFNHGGVDSITSGVGCSMAYTKGARRYDAGQYMSLTSMPMIQESLRLIGSWGPDRIAAYLKPVVDAIAEACAGLGLDVVRPAVRSPHFVGVRRKGGFPPDLPARLDRLGVHASARGGALRLSPYMFNEPGDAARLRSALESALGDSGK